MWRQQVSFLAIRMVLNRMSDAIFPSFLPSNMVVDQAVIGWRLALIGTHIVIFSRTFLESKARNDTIRISFIVKLYIRTITKL